MYDMSYPPPQLEPSQHPLIDRLYTAASALEDRSPSEVAKRLNMSVQVVTNWSTRGISKEGALAAQEAYGVNANWLLGTSAEPTPIQSQAIRRFETRPGYRRFQVMGEGGAGPGVVNVDYPEVVREIEIAEWQLQEELGRLPSPNRVKLLTVRGHSMAPRIRNGDVVFVDIEDKAPADGGLFVIVLHGHALVKRLEIRRDGYHVVSLATPDRPDIYAPDQTGDLVIAGRVLGAMQLRKAEDL